MKGKDKTKDRYFVGPRRGLVSIDIPIEKLLPLQNKSIPKECVIPRSKYYDDNKIEFFIRRKAWAREELERAGLNKPGDRLVGNFEGFDFEVVIGPRKGIQIYGDHPYKPDPQYWHRRHICNSVWRRHTPRKPRGA